MHGERDVEFARQRLDQSVGHGARGGPGGLARRGGVEAEDQPRPVGCVGGGCAPVTARTMPAARGCGRAASAGFGCCGLFAGSASGTRTKFGLSAMASISLSIGRYPTPREVVGKTPGLIHASRGQLTANKPDPGPSGRTPRRMAANLRCRITAHVRWSSRWGQSAPWLTLRARDLQRTGAQTWHIQPPAISPPRRREPADRRQCRASGPSTASCAPALSSPWPTVVVDPSRAQGAARLSPPHRSVRALWRRSRARIAGPGDDRTVRRPSRSTLRGGGRAASLLQAAPPRL